jgi:hypothetical protein
MKSTDRPFQGVSWEYEIAAMSKMMPGIKIIFFIILPFCI